MTPRFQRESFTSEAAQRLVAEVQQEYVRRYGDVDATELTAADFEPPAGAFYVCYLDGRPVASGAWRSHGGTDAEMKRLFVIESARGQGLARAMVAQLEVDAAAAGRTRMILETGSGQPEALALYAALGYRPITPFGLYAGEPGASHLGKALRRGQVSSTAVGEVAGGSSRLPLSSGS